MICVIDIYRIYRIIYTCVAHIWRIYSRYGSRSADVNLRPFESSWKTSRVMITASMLMIIMSIRNQDPRNRSPWKHLTVRAAEVDRQQLLGPHLLRAVDLQAEDQMEGYVHQPASAVSSTASEDIQYNTIYLIQYIQYIAIDYVEYTS